MSFLGYPREDGQTGVRNYIGIISTVVCANDVSYKIAQQVKGTAAYLHDQGCCQTPVDLEIVKKTLINLGKNPNLAGVLLVSLGCESIVPKEIAQEIAKTGKPVETVYIQESGGMLPAIALGTSLAHDMAVEASKIKREECPDEKLVIAVKCGASDTTSGLISNPSAGAALDIVNDLGGTCIFGETTEFIGAEHTLVKRAINKEVGEKILYIVNRMEGRSKKMGV
ncbi:MAG: UxaA family hydrolase, partial [Atribacterota bacterium]|nr:UxaA family hydrolase [Atribacterota bacterium]